MKTTLLLLISILLFFSCEEKNENATLNQNKPDSITFKLDSLLNVYENNNQFMGSIALFHNDKTVYENSVGFSDVESKKKAKTNTKYRIGSVSKTFTAVLIFKAIEEGKLELNVTLENYFPNVKNASKITIAHLLQHRSGILSITEDKSFFDNRTQYISSKDMLSKISNYESVFEPNSKGEYSNSNYFLLALLLEKIYNTTYGDLLQEKICKPLTLTNTYAGEKIKFNENESLSYSFNNKWTKFPETHMSYSKGTASIVSTSNDLNSFIKGLFTGQLLSAKSLTLMKTIKDRIGMGLFRFKIFDKQAYGHRGRIDEFRSTIIYFPKEHLAFSLISNGSTIDINELYLEILKIYFEETPVEISENEVKKFVGVYISQIDSNDKSVFIQDKNVLVNFIKNEFKAPLIYRGDNRFVLEQLYAESISFTFSNDGKQMVFEQSDFKAVYLKE